MRARPLQISLRLLPSTLRKPILQLSSLLYPIFVLHFICTIHSAYHERPGPYSNYNTRYNYMVWRRLPRIERKLTWWPASTDPSSGTCRQQLYYNSANIPFTSQWCGDASTPNPSMLLNFWVNNITTDVTVTDSLRSNTSTATKTTISTRTNVFGFISVTPQIATASITGTPAPNASIPDQRKDDTIGIRRDLRNAYILLALSDLLVAILLFVIIYQIRLLAIKSRQFLPRKERPEITKLLADLRGTGFGTSR